MHKLPSTKLGVDGINLTIPAANATAKEVAFGLFGVPLSKWYPADPGSTWYGSAYQLYSAQYVPGKRGAVLAMLFTDYRQNSGKGRHTGSHHHLQIHGHALSASALNPFNSSAVLTLPDTKNTSIANAVPASAKPLTVPHILSYVASRNGKITELHTYLDLFGFDVPFQALVHQAKSEEFKDYFRSTFLRPADYYYRDPVTDKRIKKHGVQPPLPYPPVNPNGIYIGRYGHSYSQVYSYQKHNDPHHRINDQVQALKYTWHRVEVRLKGQTGKRAGSRLLAAFAADPSSIDRTTLQMVLDYIAFTSPDGPTKRDKPLQDWWLRAVTMAQASVRLG